MATRDDRERSRKVWFDPRFAIGVALVAVSIASVMGIVAAADRTVAVYSAPSALVAGERVTAHDLAVEHVRFGGADRYLGPESLPSDGVVVTRPVGAGELIPLAAVGDRAGIRSAPVVVSVTGALALSIAPGAVVDVWSSPPAEGANFGPPSVLVPSATVVRIIESSGIIAERGGASVELLVPRDRIARVLEAAANSNAIALVATSLPVSR